MRGCFTGIVAMAWRDIPGYAIYMVIYEWLFAKLYRSKYSDKHGVAASLIAGGWAGVLCWLAVMPFDVFKSQIQADLGQEEYRGMWGCAAKTYKKFGVRGLYTGAVINSIRAFPVNAVTFVFYSQVLRLLNKQPSTVVDVIEVL